MYLIDQSHRNGFVSQINGFIFQGKKISSLDDIKAAIDFIYNKKAVLYRKRIKGKYCLRGNKAIEAKLDALLDELAQRIYDYFNKPGNVTNNQSNFDEFHHGICQWFLNELNKIRKMAGLPPATYGNAQKMINILFKYLACFDDYPKYADLFSYCHMPIDGYIARALKDKGIIVPSTPWYGLTYQEYIDLQNEIRLKLPRAPYMSILEAEFILWPIAAKGRRCKGVLLNITSWTQAPKISYFFVGLKTKGY
ncbi:MAG: hypothetical protein SO007_07890 [Candidatus Enteromonas sp.]|nr:hypothetical protein [Candidatus Enteromonas sp.]